MTTQKMNRKAKLFVTVFALATVIPAHSQGNDTWTRLIQPSGNIPGWSIAGSQPQSAASVTDALADSKRLLQVKRSEITANPNARFGRQGIPTQPSNLNHARTEVVGSLEGLNAYQSMVASGFQREPPDQGLCTGKGMVLESVNDGIRIYDASGNALGSAVSFESFYGHARHTAFIFDPSCHFDDDTQRWFHLVSVLEEDPATRAFTGPTYLELAVSQSSDPSGGWYLYRIHTEDNGTNGTPDHGCSLGFCYGDFPHLGADDYGIYLSTNEFSLFGGEFKSANIYAISKRGLVGGTPVNVVQFATPNAAAGNPGFTVLGALSPPHDNGRGTYQANGIEYFLSSDANPLTGNTTGQSDHLFLWTMTNTSSLDSRSPALGFTNQVVSVNRYVIPPFANQKSGNTPLAQCLAQDCFGFGFTIPDSGVGVIATGDSGITRVFYAHGKLWTSVGTAVNVGGLNRAGAEWFIVNPATARVEQQGYVALANNHIVFPSVAVAANGKGIMAFTITGNDYDPSAGYAALDEGQGLGPIHMITEAPGPQDGLSEYLSAFGIAPLWGDYSAAVTDGVYIWIGSEVISQTCTYAQFLADPTCGGTRTPTTNWSTRLTKLLP